MSESVTCPHCGEQLPVPESYRGEQVKCPSCLGEFLAGPLLSIATAIAAGPGDKAPPTNAGTAETNKDAADKVRQPPRHRPLLPREQLPARAPRPIAYTPPRPAAQILGFVIIGMAVVGLVVAVGHALVLELWPEQGAPRVFVRGGGEARLEIQQALRNDVPLNEAQIALELQPLFDDLGTSLRAQDQDRIMLHFDVERLYDELHDLLPEPLRRGRAEFVLGLRNGLGQTLRLQAPLLAWKHVEFKHIKKLPGNEAAVIVRHYAVSGATVKMRWWVTKKQGTWRIYDFEDLDVGLRLYDDMGLLSSLKPAELHTVVEGVKKLRAAILAVAVQHNPGAAEALLKEVAEIHFPKPQKAVFHVVTAMALIQRNRNAEALAALARARECNRDMPVLDYLEGMALNRLGRWEPALQHLQAYRDLLGDDAIMCRELGLALYGVSRMPEAQAAYRKALDYDPKNGTAFLSLLRTLRPGDRKDDLGSRFALLNNLQANFDICARDCLRSRDYQALEAIALALGRSDPKSPAADLHLALAKAHLGQAKEAVKRFQSAQAKQPDAGQRAAALDQFFKVMAQTGHAAEAYSAAPDSRAAFRALAAEAQKSFHVEDFKALVAAHRKKDAEDPLLPFYEGEIAVREEDYALAHKAFAAGMAHPPDAGTLERFRRSRVLARYRCNQGLAAYAEIDPREATFRQLAQLCVQDQDDKLLAALLDAHAKNDPGDVELLRYRFCLRIHEQRFAEAIALFREALGKVAPGPRRQELISTFLIAMDDAGKMLEGYQAAPDAHQAFQILAVDLMDDGRMDGLRKLVEAHRLRQADDPWLSFYETELFSADKAWDRAAETAGKALSMAPKELQDRLRHLYVLASYHQGQSLEIYGRLEPKRQVFDELAQLLARDKKGPELEALLAAHRPHAAEDPDLLYYEACARLIAGKVEEAIPLLEEAYRKQPLAWKRNNYLTHCIDAMVDAGKPLAAYQAAPDQSFAFTVLARKLVTRKQAKALRELLDQHARNHPGDPWLHYYEGELSLLRGEPQAARQQFAAGLAMAASITQGSYHNGVYRAALKCGAVADAYREAGGGLLPFRTLANLCLQEKSAQQLAALLEAHRKSCPDDPELPVWQAEARWLDGDHEGAYRLLAALRQDLAPLPGMMRRKVEDLRIRCLLKLKRHDEAVREAEALPAYHWNTPLLRVLAHAEQGGVKAACGQMEKLPRQRHVLQSYYHDPDLGPILRSEPFREFRERFPEPKAREQDDL